MVVHIQEAMRGRDTLGGVFEVVALGVPPGLGSHVHWDRRLTGRLAQAMLSIHAMKGVEIGDAFENAGRPGTQVQDAIYKDPAGTLTRNTNRSGGLEGGITTGEPIVLRVAMKPIATTLTPIDSVDLVSGEPRPIEYGAAPDRVRAFGFLPRAPRRRDRRGDGLPGAGGCADRKAGR